MCTSHLSAKYNFGQAAFCRSVSKGQWGQALGEHLPLFLYVSVRVQLPPSNPAASLNNLHLCFSTIRVKMMCCSKALQLGWVTSAPDSSDEGLLESPRWWRLSSALHLYLHCQHPRLSQPTPQTKSLLHPLPSASITITHPTSTETSTTRSRPGSSTPFFFLLLLLTASVSFPATDSYIFLDKYSPWILHLLTLSFYFIAFSNSLSFIHFFFLSVHLHIYSSFFLSGLCECFALSSFPPFFFLSPSHAPLLIAQFLLFSTYLLQFDAFHLAWIILPLSIHLRFPFSSAPSQILILHSPYFVSENEYLYVLPSMLRF